MFVDQMPRNVTPKSVLSLTLGLEGGYLCSRMSLDLSHMEFTTPPFLDVTKTPLLKHLVVINLEQYNSTQPDDSRTSITIELPRGEGYRHAQIRRLTALGAEVKEGITLAGQNANHEGILE